MDTYLMLATSSTELLKSTAWLIGLIIGVAVLWYLVDYAEVKPPFNKLLKAVLIVVGLVILVLYIFHVAGKPPF